MSNSLSSLLLIYVIKAMESSEWLCISDKYGNEYNNLLKKFHTMRSSNDDLSSEDITLIEDILNYL